MLNQCAFERAKNIPCAMGAAVTVPASDQARSAAPQVAAASMSDR